MFVYGHIHIIRETYMWAFAYVGCGFARELFGREDTIMFLPACQRQVISLCLNSYDGIPRFDDHLPHVWRETG